MVEKEQLKKDVRNGKTYEFATGEIEYNLTNDYMFKAVFQESEEALIGLVSAILGISPEDISVNVANPIVLGKSVVNKDFYLDILVVVNNKDRINLEMQITDYGDWPERSLAYSSRSFDNIKKGEKYKDISPFHHVSFLTFDIFENNNLFLDTFMLSSVRSSQVFTSKFKISVIDLKRINEATEADKKYNLDKWCKFITASRWEEVRELVKEDPYMQVAAEKAYELSEDFQIREEARRRREYYEYVESLAATIEEKETVIESKLHTIEEQETVIESSLRTIEEKNSLINGMTSEIEEKDSVIESNLHTIKEQETVIESSLRTIEEQETVIESSLRTIEEQDSLINGMTSEIEEKDSVIESNLHTIKEQETMIESSLRTIEEKDSLINGMTSEIKEKDFLIESTKRTIEEKDSIISKLQAELDKYRRNE